MYSKTQPCRREMRDAGMQPVGICANPKNLWIFGIIRDQ